MPKTSPKSVSPKTTKLATGKTRDPRKPETKATPAASKAKAPIAAEPVKPIAKANGSNGHSTPAAAPNGKQPAPAKGAPEAAKTAPAPKAAPAKGKTAAPTPVISVIDQPDVQEKMRDLIRLAKEQGYLTFDDLNEALPEQLNDPDEMEIIMGRLRGMEIDIIDASDVDRYKDGKKDADEEEDEKDEKPEQRLDILDDPVRMYLKQMGQVPLLTREQEVEISKRIEEAELCVQKYLNRFGFTVRMYLDLARKLHEQRERFDRVILDKKIESRERYMKN